VVEAEFVEEFVDFVGGLKVALVLSFSFSLW
jgi:hypothetical protein